MIGNLQLPGRIIRASAGSGKTFQLTRQFIHLLMQGDTIEHPERILAMTFTRAAAGEIRERLLEDLSAAVLDENGLAFEQLAEFLPQGMTRDELQSRLIRLVRNLKCLRIRTIDSFFMQLARVFAFDIDLPTEWSIGNDHELVQIQREAIASLLRVEDASGFRLLMHDLQDRRPQGTITEQVEKTVRDAYGLVRDTDSDAWNWFPEPALLEEKVLAGVVAALEAASFEGTASFDTRRKKDILSFTERSWKAFLDTGIAAKVNRGETTYVSPRNVITDEIRSLYEPLVQHARNCLLRDIGTRTRATRDLIERYARELALVRLHTPVYDFDDLSHRLKVAMGQGMLELMYYRLDGVIDHLLIDEFQDTSMDQWAVLHPLAIEIASDHEHHRSIMCVGDVKQSLYAFRGGQPELLEHLEEQLPSLEISQEHLIHSWRSSPAIIDIVNTLFSSIEENPALDRPSRRTGAERWKKNFTPHTTVHDGRPGYAELRTAPASTQEARIAIAVEKVREIHAVLPGASIGVLVRSNTKGQIATILNLLQQGENGEGVPCSGQGGNPLTDSVAVTHLLSLLVLIDHPGDTIARFHVLHSPLRALFGEIPGDSDPSDEDLARWCRKARLRLVIQGYPDCLAEWAGFLARDADNYDQLRISQLLDLVAGEKFSPTLRPSDCVAFIRQERVHNPMSARVQVMTIHKSKGLQFDAVVLPDMEGAIGGKHTMMAMRENPLATPCRVSLYTSDVVARADTVLMAMHEDAQARGTRDTLCALYVSMTRARYGLYVIIEPSSKSEKAYPARVSGLLRGGLLGEQEPAAPSTVLWSTGHAGWAESEEDSIQALRECPQIDTASPLPPIELAATSGRWRGLARATPSGLEGRAVISGAEVLARPATEILGRGTLMHAWCERIRWLGQDPPTLQELLENADTIGADPGSAATWGVEFLAAIGAPAINALLQEPDDEATYEVHTELPFAVIVPGGTSFAHRKVQRSTFLRGSIDRLVIRRRGTVLDGITVVDFKTGEGDLSNPAVVEELHLAYGPQLASYRYAVSRMYTCPPDRISTQLAMLDCDAVLDMTATL